MIFGFRSLATVLAYHKALAYHRSIFCPLRVPDDVLEGRVRRARARRQVNMAFAFENRPFPLRICSLHIAYAQVIYDLTPSGRIAANDWEREIESGTEGHEVVDMGWRVENSTVGW